MARKSERRRDERPKPSLGSRRRLSDTLHRRPVRWDVFVRELGAALARRCLKLKPRLRERTLRFPSDELDAVGRVLARGVQVLFQQAVGRGGPWADALDAGRGLDEATARDLAARSEREALEPLLRKFVEDTHAAFLPRPCDDLDRLAAELRDALLDLLLARCAAPDGDLRDCFTDPLGDPGGALPDNGRPPDPARPTGSVARDVYELGIVVREADDPGDLKRKLADFAKHDPWLTTEALVTVLADVADAEAEGSRDFDAGHAINRATDDFLFRATRVGGRTPIELLIERQVALPEVQRRRLARWDAEAFAGVFQIRAVDAPFLTLELLRDGSEFRAMATRAEALRSLRNGNLIRTRIAPWDDHWLLSGVQDFYPAPAPKALDQLRRQLLARPSPRPPREDDPAYQRAMTLEARRHAAWVELFGTDELLFDDGEELQEAVDRFERYWAGEAIDPETGLTRAAGYARDHGTPPPPLPEVPLPDDLLDSGDVAAVADPRHGMMFLDGYGLFRSAFETDGPPTPAQLRQVWSYLADDSVEPVVFDRLRDRHPARAQQLFRLALRDEGFELARDYGPLMRKFKGESLRRPPRPTITVVDGPSSVEGGDG